VASGTFAVIEGDGSATMFNVRTPISIISGVIWIVVAVFFVTVWG
jgi:preprotein translocase subunit SecG